MNKKNNKEEILKRILTKVRPEIKFKNIGKKIKLVNDGILDSLDIIQLISEIEKISKKKIDPNKLSRNTFTNFKSMLKLIN